MTSLLKPAGTAGWPVAPILRQCKQLGTSPKEVEKKFTWNICWVQLTWLVNRHIHKPQHMAEHLLIVFDDAGDARKRWNPPYGGAPSSFCEEGGQEEFGHNLVCCGRMWLTGFMGQPLFALGQTCVYFVARDFLSLKVGPSTNSNFSLIFKI